MEDAEIAELEKQQTWSLTGGELVNILIWRIKNTNALEFIKEKDKDELYFLLETDETEIS